jgi:hypothetical protein
VPANPLGLGVPLPPGGSPDRSGPRDAGASLLGLKGSKSSNSSRGAETRLGPDRHHVLAYLLAVLAEISPLLHQAAALIPNVAPLIGAFQWIALDM